MKEREKARDKSSDSDNPSNLRSGGRNASPDAESRWGGSTVYSKDKAAGS